MSKKDISDFIVSTLAEAGISMEEFQEKVQEGREVYTDSSARKEVLHKMLTTLSKSLDDYEQIKDRMSTAESITFLKRWNMAAQAYELAKDLDQEMDKAN